VWAWASQILNVFAGLTVRSHPETVTSRDRTNTPRGPPSGGAARPRQVDLSIFAALVLVVLGADAATLQLAGLLRSPRGKSCTRCRPHRACHRTWIQPRVSFRRSQSFTVNEPNTALWLRLVDRSAEHITVPPLRPAALRKVARTIPAMTNHTIPHGFAVARSALAEAGVILTFVREAPSTRVSGVTWWQGPERPVIGLTERYRKPDTFWFNLLHEIAHVLLHPRRSTFLDLELEKGVSDGAEREAHDFAENTLLPEEARARIAAAATREDLLRLATTFGVSVSVVAGRYGRATDKWGLVSSLRGTISDDDICGLERISNAGKPEDDSDSGSLAC
jgi:hypothetical protein